MPTGDLDEIAERLARIRARCQPVIAIAGSDASADAVPLIKKIIEIALDEIARTKDDAFLAANPELSQKVPKSVRRAALQTPRAKPAKAAARNNDTYLAAAPRRMAFCPAICTMAFARQSHNDQDARKQGWSPVTGR